MKVQELANRLELKAATRVFDKDVTGVYISDMVSDVIANAKAGDLLVTAQAHANVIAAANLVDTCAVVVTQGKALGDDVVKMAEKAEDIPKSFESREDHVYIKLSCYQTCENAH